MVRCEQLSIAAGRRTIITNLDLTLPDGVYGLLGLNGAGKTTLLRTLSTAHLPATGKLTILGSEVGTLSAGDLRVLRQQIGYAPQQPMVLGHLSVLEQVAYAAWLKKIPARQRTAAATTAIEAVNLQDKLKERTRTLSGGMLRRLGIAMAMVHRPALLLLDEPTAGLDPEQRVAFRSLVADLGAASVVVLSTHLVEDVAKSCHRVGVLSGGNIVFDGTVDELVVRGAEYNPAGRTPVEAGFSAVIGGLDA